jgi:mannose-1-phosphate guanylyltransferase/mannose-1-phosphate guanylyltransferase/phosphomannomutase
MAHILGLLNRQGFDEVIANLHYFPDAVRGYFGDRVEYRYEEELLGTAGGVRNVADFFGDDPVVVISGDALTDVNLNALLERHREAGGIGTLTVKKVPDTREYGVVIHDSEGRIQGFQEKPEPAEALSDLGNCGIYCFSPEIFDYFPEEPFADWAQDVFPALLENDVPFHVYETEDYWNDVGSLAELREGTWDALSGRLNIEVTGATDGDPPVWTGHDVDIGSDVRLMGPVAIGDRCRIGDGCALRDTIVFPGTEVAAGTIAIGAIIGRGGIVEAMRPLDELE